MNTLHRTIGYIITLLILVAGVHLAHAQSSPANLLFGERPDSVAFSLDPAYPEPNEQVTVSVTGNEFSIDTATVVWSRNGQTVRRGVGVSEYTFRTGEVGNLEQIRVTVIKPDGNVVTGSTVVRPGDIDLVWEADSYTPPFYRGKALRAPRGRARVVSFVNVADRSGNPISNNDLFFKWIFNGRALADFSGYGEDTFPSDVSSHRNTIALEISTRDDTVLAREEITIPNVDTKVLIYEKKPLAGIDFANPLRNDHTLDENEMTLFAAPYFFDISNIRVQNFNYEWRADGTILSGANSQEITLTRSNRDGSVRVGANVTHPQNLQGASGVITIQLPADNE